MNLALYLQNVLYRMLFYAPILVISITVHEYAHARTAQALGDPTAAQQGRVSLNPLRHLDPVGSVLMLLFGFGWGKPVPVAALNFKKPKRDMALVAVAGPVSNLLMACLWGFLYGALAAVLPQNGYFATLFTYGVYVNCSLFLFNLIPFAPLDGSRILGAFLPNRIYYKLMQYERWFFILLMVLTAVGAFTWLLNFLGQYVVAGINATFVRLGQLLYSAIAGLF